MRLFGSEITCELLRDLTPRAVASEQNEALAAARRILRSEAVALIELDRATMKGSLIRVRADGREFYLKRHRRQSAYSAERSVLQLLSGRGLTPALIGHEDASASLLIESIPGVTSAKTRTAWHFRALGKIHGLWEVRTANSGGDLEPQAGETWQVPKVSVPEIPLVDAFRSGLGPEWHPLSIGDLKIDHVRGTRSRMRLIDFDHTRLDRFDLYDLVMLTLERVDRRPLAILLDLYDQGRRSTGSHAPRITPFADVIPTLANEVEAWLHEQVTRQTDG